MFFVLRSLKKVYLIHRKVIFQNVIPLTPLTFLIHLPFGKPIHGRRIRLRFVSIRYSIAMKRKVNFFFQFYQFTLFAMSLNEMKPGVALCPTDSRLRPDIRKLEAGDIDGAALEKTRLEEKQRDVRKAKKSKKGEEFTPRWLVQNFFVLQSTSFNVKIFRFSTADGSTLALILIQSKTTGFIPADIGTETTICLIYFKKKKNRFFWQSITLMTFAVSIATDKKIWKRKWFRLTFSMTKKKDKI